MNRTFVTLGVTCVLFVAGCAAAPASIETLPPPDTATDEPATSTAPPKVTPTLALSTPAPSGQPIPKEPAVQELPPRSLLDQIIADLARRAGVSADAVAVVRSEAIVWNDGSLGCPQPGFAYTQALVPGYHIILEASGQKFDYHTSESHFVLCEN